jgi:hypothetical protein
MYFRGPPPRTIPTPCDSHVNFSGAMEEFFFISEFAPFILIHLNRSNHRELKGKMKKS